MGGETRLFCIPHFTHYPSVKLFCLSKKEHLFAKVVKLVGQTYPDHIQMSIG